MESITIQQQQQQQQFVAQNGQIEFQFVRNSYPTGEKLFCYFSAPSTGVCKPESGDWVAISKVGSTLLKDMKCKKMVNVEECIFKPTTGVKSTYEHVITFEKYELPTETQQYYQFVYVKNGDLIHGISKPFTFVAEGEYMNYPTIQSTMIQQQPTQYKFQYPVEQSTNGKHQRIEGELQEMINELRQREEKISNIRRQLVQLKNKQQQQEQQLNAKPEQLRQLKEQARTLEQELENGLQSLQFGLKTMTVQGVEQKQEQQLVKYGWEKTIQQVERKLREQQQLKQEQRHIELQQVQIQIRQLENLLAKQQQREFEQQQREYQQIQWQIREFEQRVQNSKLTAAGVELRSSSQWQQQEQQQVEQVRKLENFLKEKLQATIEKRQTVCQQLEERIRELRRQVNEQQLNEFQYLIRHHQQVRDQCKQIGEQYMTLWQQIKPVGQQQLTGECLPEKYYVQLKQQLRELEQVMSEQQRVEEQCLRQRQERLHKLVREIEIDLNNKEVEQQEIVARWQSKYQQMPEYVNVNGGIMQQQRHFEGRYKQRVQQRIQELQQQHQQLQQQLQRGEQQQQPREHWQIKQIQSLEQQIAEFKSQLKGQLVCGGEYITGVQTTVPRQWIRQVVQKLRELECYIKMEKYEQINGKETTTTTTTTVTPTTVYPTIYETVLCCGGQKQQQPTKLWLEKRQIQLTQWIKFFEIECQQPIEQEWTESKIRMLFVELKELESFLVEFKQVFGGVEQQQYQSLVQQPTYKQYINGEYCPTQTTKTTTMPLYKPTEQYLNQTRIYQLTVELKQMITDKVFELKQLLTQQPTTTPFGSVESQLNTPKVEIVERLWEQVRCLESELEELRKFELEQPETLTTQTTPYFYQQKRQQELIQQRLAELEEKIIECQTYNGEYKQQQILSVKYELIFQHVCELESLWRLVKQHQKQHQQFIQQQQQEYMIGEFNYQQEEQFLHVQQRQLFRQVMRLFATLERICQETNKVSQQKPQWQQIPTESFYFGQQIVQLLQKIRTLKRQIPVEQHEITLFMIHHQIQSFVMHIQEQFVLPTHQQQFRKFKQMLRNLETRYVAEHVQIEELEEQLKQQFKYQVQLQQVIKYVEQFLFEQMEQPTLYAPRTVQYYIRLVKDLHAQLRCWEECIFEQEYEQQQQGQEFIQTLKELIGGEINNNCLFSYEQQQPQSIFGGLWGLLNGQKNGEIELFFGQPEQYFPQQYNKIIVELVHRYISSLYKPTTVEQEFRRKFEQLFVEQSKLGQQIRNCVYEYVQMNGLFAGEQIKQQLEMRLAQQFHHLQRQQFEQQPRYELFRQICNEEETLEQPKGTLTIERIERTPFQQQQPQYRKKFVTPVEQFEQFGQMSIQDEIEQQLNKITKPTVNVVRSVIYPTESIYPTISSSRPEEQYKSVGIEVRFPEQQQPTLMKRQSSSFGGLTGLNGLTGLTGLNSLNSLTGLNGQCQVQKYSHVQKEMKQVNGETVVSDVEQIQFVICPLCGIAVNKLNQPEFELHVNSHFTD